MLGTGATSRDQQTPQSTAIQSTGSQQGLSLSATEKTISFCHPPWGLGMPPPGTSERKGCGLNGSASLALFASKTNAQMGKPQSFDICYRTAKTALRTPASSAPRIPGLVRSQIRNHLERSFRPQLSNIPREWLLRVRMGISPQQPVLKASVGQKATAVRR